MLSDISVEEISHRQVPGHHGDPLPGQARYGKELRHYNIKSASDQDIVELRKLLATHGLLIFRDQVLEDHHLIHFSRRLGSGKIEAPPKAFNSPSDSIAYLTNLKKPDGAALGFAADSTDVWHSDQEFREAPASIAMLYCLIPTENEGATSFATTAVENLDIDPNELSELRELWSTRQAASIVAHPVVETNPFTGSEFIYVSENTRQFIGPDGESIADSDKKAAYLLEKILKPENIYSHPWKQGDVLLYDNMQLLHRREAYQGIRFLKAVKFHPDGEYVVRPAGKMLRSPQ
ncbi:TauD/TfdA dioxygenase family protein [Xanthomonas sp. SHU 199]|uniref:TauD/TfdA dioxygenase family protein n=1 Tax=Xanthomonas sp. SHU 199 TaxID=1591174 RepID=UPI0003A79ABB|nr:TauD/TfdA family dioxygenase [Xanthomonas sp. SHU 199]